MEACCTCATLLSSVTRASENEKPLPDDRRLACCTRVICGPCIHNNSRFAFYCPYCQITSAPTTLPQGLREPPSYNAATSSAYPEPPPPYNPVSISLRDTQPVDDEKAALAAEEKSPADDILHFLNHEHDTIPSLSLRYGVPAQVLRQTNKLPSDHLLIARKTILIPGEWYKGGVSLSPRPVEGEEEELRKSKVRRWMVGCKNANYDVAVLYLEQADYDLAAAMEAYFEDEAWEKDHPLEAGRRRGNGVGTGGTWAAQAAFLKRQGPS